MIVMFVAATSNIASMIRLSLNVRYVYHDKWPMFPVILRIPISATAKGKARDNQIPN